MHLNLANGIGEDGLFGESVVGPCGEQEMQIDGERRVGVRRIGWNPAAAEVFVLCDAIEKQSDGVAGVGALGKFAAGNRFEVEWLLGAKWLGIGVLQVRHQGVAYRVCRK